MQECALFPGSNDGDKECSHFTEKGTRNQNAFTGIRKGKYMFKLERFIISILNYVFRHNMGLIPTRRSLELADKVTATSFCR